jgi:hypothetical protein
LDLVEGVSFTANSIQIGGDTGAPAVFVASVVSAADAHALAHALAWQRARRFLAPAAETAEDVIALREIVSLIDAVDYVAAGGPLHLSQSQVLLLTEAAALYVAERDHDEYIEPTERERLSRLRALSDRLMGVAADLASALEHASAARH